MKINKEGIDLICKYEGCVLYPYNATGKETYMTIGYGHYGADVPGIYNKALEDHGEFTKSDARKLLKDDLVRFEKYVENDCKHLKLNVNQFSALVSFTYNCGRGNLLKLIKNRDTKTIGDKMILYNKAGGVTLEGLKKRRTAEQKLYKKAVE